MELEYGNQRKKNKKNLNSLLTFPIHTNLLDQDNYNILHPV